MAKLLGPSPVPETLRTLRNRAGLSMAVMARELGLKGSSSYQRFEDVALFRRPYLPLGLLPLFKRALLGKGKPPITVDEINPLFGLTALIIETAAKPSLDLHRDHLASALAIVDAFSAETPLDAKARARLIRRIEAILARE